MTVRSKPRSKAKTPATTSHIPRKRGRPVVDDKRRRVLDAALKVFAERGYHGTSVPDVAAAARIGTGTFYHYFEHKQRLVNEVYRDAKLRLRSRLLGGLAEPDVGVPGAVHAWFFELWRRLAAYARQDPYAFRFLEMQDHADYLDVESRQFDLTTLTPLVGVGYRIYQRAGTAKRIDVVIALMWGAFVGLVKASRLGYLQQLDDTGLESAGEIVWRMLEPEVRSALAANTNRG